MALDLRRHSHRAWDDALGRAHDLYDDGLSGATDLYRHGRDRAEDVYGRGRRHAVDVYGESRHRASRTADALAGRRTIDTGPIVVAAAVGVVAGAALVIGAIWWLRRPPANHTAVEASSVEPNPDAVEDLLADDGAGFPSRTADPLR